MPTMAPFEDHEARRSTQVASTSKIVRLKTLYGRRAKYHTGEFGVATV